MDALATAGKVLAGLVILGLFVSLIVVAARDHARWEEWCYEAGGRVDKDTSIGITYVDGKQGTTTSTTYYCLTDDGRVLDIY